MENEENEEIEEIDFFEWWEMLDDIEREEYNRCMKELEESDLQCGWEMARYGSGNDETIITEYLENTHLEKGIKQKNLDTVLELIDEYVDLKEIVEMVK